MGFSTLRGHLAHKSASLSIPASTACFAYYPIKETLVNKLICLKLILSSSI